MYGGFYGFGRLKQSTIEQKIHLQGEKLTSWSHTSTKRALFRTVTLAMLFSGDVEPSGKETLTESSRAMRQATSSCTFPKRPQSCAGIPDCESCQNDHSPGDTLPLPLSTPSHTTPRAHSNALSIFARTLAS